MIKQKYSISECTVQRFYQKLHRGEFSLEDEEGSGCLSAIDDVELKVSVETNPRTIREFAEHVLEQFPKISNELKCPKSWTNRYGALKIVVKKLH